MTFEQIARTKQGFKARVQSYSISRQPSCTETDTPARNAFAQDNAGTFVAVFRASDNIVLERVNDHAMGKGSEAWSRLKLELAHVFLALARRSRLRKCRPEKPVPEPAQYLATCCSIRPSSSSAMPRAASRHSAVSILVERLTTDSDPG